MSENLAVTLICPFPFDFWGAPGFLRALWRALSKGEAHRQLAESLDLPAPLPSLRKSWNPGSDSSSGKTAEGKQS